MAIELSCIELKWTWKWKWQEIRFSLRGKARTRWTQRQRPYNRDTNCGLSNK